MWNAENMGVSMKTAEEILQEYGQDVEAAEAVRAYGEQVKEECVKILLEAYDGGIYADVIRDQLKLP
jgi:hypothetical protein